MNDLRLIADFTPPPLPDDLKRALRVLRYRAENAIRADPEPHPWAARYLAQWRQQITPTTLALVRQWLDDLAVGVSAPPSSQDTPMGTRAAAVFMTCEDFPAACWTRASLVLAMRTFKWFPTPSEVYALLKPEADRIDQTLVGLEAIANAKPAEAAIPAREAYKPPPVPDWVGDRTIRGEHGRRMPNIQPPLRSVAEQIALLNAG